MLLLHVIIMLLLHVIITCYYYMLLLHVTYYYHLLLLLITSFIRPTLIKVQSLMIKLTTMRCNNILNSQNVLVASQLQEQ